MPESQSLTLPAKAELLGAVTRFVREGARAANLPEARMDEVDLLVEEVFMNIARYAYAHEAEGIVSLAYSVAGPRQLEVEFADRGVEFNPLEAADPELAADLDQRRAGGLGLFLVKHFADSLSYRREDGWNRLRFGISARP